MQRKRLPWFFTALALVSPPLLWIFRESNQQWFEMGYRRQDDAFANIIWFFLAVTVWFVFTVLAFATWSSQSRWHAVLRRRSLLTLGALSLLAGLLSLAYLNLLVKEWGFRPFVLEWAPGVVMIASGFFAIRAWRDAQAQA